MLYSNTCFEQHGSGYTPSHEKRGNCVFLEVALDLAHRCLEDWKEILDNVADRNHQVRYTLYEI